MRNPKSVKCREREIERVREKPGRGEVDRLAQDRSPKVI